MMAGYSGSWHDYRSGNSFRPFRVGGLERFLMRDDYLNEALKVVMDPNLLVNLVSRRVKQLRRGGRPLIESLEKLSLEDMALREIFEKKISWEVPDLAGKDEE